MSNPKPRRQPPTENVEQVLGGMRNRVAQCRRLAATLINDPARDALLQMAEEIEADMLRLQSDR